MNPDHLLELAEKRVEAIKKIIDKNKLAIASTENVKITFDCSGSKVKPSITVFPDSENIDRNKQ